MSFSQYRVLCTVLLRLFDSRVEEVTLKFASCSPLIACLTAGSVEPQVSSKCCTRDATATECQQMGGPPTGSGRNKVCVLDSDKRLAR